MRKTCSGGITVFLSVVFPFALLFFVCLFWYGRQSAMKNSIRNDVDAAGFSVLAEYEKDWVNEYGLYVIPQNQIESDMKFYMEINSAHSWGDYQIDELTITQTKSLQDPAELQEQIMMFMNERGWLELIEEIGSLVLQIKDLDQQVDEEINWKESDELLLIQELYGELVTLFEGIRNDGKREPYSINLLLDDEPTLEEVKKVLDEEKLTSEQVGVLEQAYDELDQVAVLCGEAIMISEELEKAIDELETNEELPVTTGQLQDYRLILHENQALCEEASKAIYNWVAVLEEEEKPEEIRERAILCTQALQEYDRSIQLPYEYRESDDSWDFSSILSSLKGYPFDIGDIAPDEELLEAANKYGVTVLVTQKATSAFTAELVRWLNVELAPCISIHGVLVDVYGEGVLIMGESGIGKSEAALELIKRGHRLVTDDVVEIRRVSDETLIGTAPDITRHFIELRGIGIIDVKTLFGVESVKETQAIDMVIKLEEWNKDNEYDRLGLEENYTEFLGNKVVCHSIPIRPGRNLAIIVESAAVNHRQKKMGYNAAQELYNRVQRNLMKNEDDD